MSEEPGINPNRLLQALSEFVEHMDKEVHDALDGALERAVGVAKGGQFFDRTGDLRDQIRYTLQGLASEDTLLGTLGAYTLYASYVENGTEPHEIRAKNRKALKIPAKGGGFYFAKSVQHPGSKPVRFMLAAVESIDMSTILDHALDRAAQKAGL
jgi:hypothetical protein